MFIAGKEYVRLIHDMNLFSSLYAWLSNIGILNPEEQNRRQNAIMP